MSFFRTDEGSNDQGWLVYRNLCLDGSDQLDSVVSGTRLEKSLLLYDSLSVPHVFLARSDDTRQLVEHFSPDESGEWRSDTIIELHNDCGKFIYEMSADTGPDYSFHLILLMTRSNIDSDDFMDAWIGSYLLYVTNASGIWDAEIIHHYDMAYTYDMYVKSSCRQDIEVDSDGYAHVVFSEQLSGTYDPSRLLYASNRAGYWGVEVALAPDPATTDDAGWFPSLCLDTSGIPYVSCMYVDRVPTHSATFCHLLLLKRDSLHHWSREVIASYDDGYYGTDGRDYTGALTHLVFDDENRPHVVFSDVASTHYPETQALCVGNIRYGYRDNSGWNFTTIYRQPVPTHFLHASEMYSTCLFLSERADSIRVIGQELITDGAYNYTTSLVDVEWSAVPTPVEEDTRLALPEEYFLGQNYPNPFNPATSFNFDLPRRAEVEISVYNMLGQHVRSLVDAELPAGQHEVSWDGTDSEGSRVSSGTYLYRMDADGITQTRKMLLLK